jgi:tripartite-type tricarboxylate transporter receptor subunit TctC
MSRIGVALRGLLAFAFALCAAAAAHAQEAYPARPITMVVPYPAGGVTDTLGRLMAEHMRASLGQSVIIENVGGAGGSVGVGRVARATGDGYTIVLGNSENFVLNAAVQTLPYDVTADFEPVALLPSYALLIVSKNAVPATDLKGLTAWIRGNAGKVTQGTVGYGTAQHLCGLSMQKTIGATWQLVPYRGGAPVMQDMLAGQIDIMCTATGSFLPLVRSGQVRAYAITAGKRAAAAPDIPTVDEAGLPGLHVSVWNAIWAPKGTPQEIVAKLNAAAVGAMADPGLRQRVTDLALDMPPQDQLTPQALAELQKAETAKWWPIIKAAGIKPE